MSVDFCGYTFIFIQERMQKKKKQLALNVYFVKDNFGKCAKGFFIIITIIIIIFIIIIIIINYIIILVKCYFLSSKLINIKKCVLRLLFCCVRLCTNENHLVLFVIINVYQTPSKILRSLATVMPELHNKLFELLRQLNDKQNYNNVRYIMFTRTIKLLKNIIYTGIHIRAISICVYTYIALKNKR